MRELFRLILNKRFRQVFFLFISFVAQFWWLGKQKRFLSEDEISKKYHNLYRKQAKRFTDTALGLGGLLIKLGQFFSSRVDILPQEYIDELAKLQDSVEAVDWKIIKDRIEVELSGPLDGIFATFSEEVLAAASLGQVHRARLISGEEVAVKVLRPGIEKIIAIDLETLKVILAFAKRYPRISNSVDLNQIYAEFKSTVSDELDYQKEADNAEKFREIFSKDKNIYVPRIYREYSTQKVLTLEFVEGYKINDLTALEKAGLDKSEVANKLITCYLRQVLLEGFFHADPHPGNLLVKNDGTLILLDFGMVSQVSEQMKDNLIDLAIALIKKDAGAVVEAFDKLGFLKPHVDRNTMQKSIILMLANLFGESIDFKKLNLSELSIEFRELIYSQPIQIPAQITFLGKALITVFGICNGLDKNFNLMEAVNPYIKEVIMPKLGGSKGKLFSGQLKKTFFDIISLPEKSNRFIDGIESGEIRFQPSRVFEERLFQQQSYLANQIIKAVLASGFVISGAQLLANYYILGVSLITVGVGTALTLLRRGVKYNSGMRRMNNMGSGFKKPRLHP